MRELIVIAIVAGLCIAALFRPFLGLLGYFWFGLMRPDILAFAAGAQPLSFALAVCVMVSSLREWSRFYLLLLNPIALSLITFCVLLTPSVFFAINPALSVPPFVDYLHAVAIPLLIPVLVRSLEDLQQLLFVVGLSLGAIGVKFGIAGILHGGAIFHDGYGGTLTDNNDLGLAFVMVVMLCWYLRQVTHARWLKLLLLFIIFTTMAGAIMTHSRGAALSLLSGLLLIIWRSRHKIALTLLLGVLVGPSVYLVKDSYTARLSTMETYQEDSSAMGRIQNAKAGLKMWADYPMFGVGFGRLNFASLTEQYGGVPGLVAHNTYIQTLADDGIVACLAYIGLLFGTMLWLRQSAKRMKTIAPELQAYPLAIQTALFSFSVGSTFLSRLQFDLIYILLMSAAAWYAIEPGTRTSGAIGSIRCSISENSPA